VCDLSFSVKLNIVQNKFQNRKQLLAIFDVEGVLYDAEYLPLFAE